MTLHLLFGAQEFLNIIERQHYWTSTYVFSLFKTIKKNCFQFKFKKVLENAYSHSRFAESSITHYFKCTIIQYASRNIKYTWKHAACIEEMFAN